MDGKDVVVLLAALEPLSPVVVPPPPPPPPLEEPPPRPMIVKELILDETEKDSERIEISSAPCSNEIWV